MEGKWRKSRLKFERQIRRKDIISEELMTASLENSQAWWDLSVIPVLGRLSQQGEKFLARPGAPEFHLSVSAVFQSAFIVNITQNTVFEHNF
jgi:hypothetical protein